MQYESDARVVHGLGIATLVLSILGILASLALAFGAGVVANVAVDVLDPEYGVMQDIIDSDSDLSDISDDADELIQLLHEADVEDFEAVANAVTVKEINGFGKVVMTGDAAKIETALKGVSAKYKLDIDEKGMAKAITGLSAKGVHEVGELLSDMDKDDLSDLRSLLSAHDAGYLNHVEGFKQAMESGEGEQVIVSGIMAVVVAIIVWMIVAYIISLIAAILAMRNCRKPAQLTGAFVWSIIAAAVGFFSGHLITMVLLIIMCVYIGKVRKYRPEIAGVSAVPPVNPGDASPVQPTGAAPIPPQE